MKAAFALLLLTTGGSAQWPGDEEIPAVAMPTLPRQVASVNGFVPKGWLLEASAAGDLNGDQRPDAALVLHMTDPRNRLPSPGDSERRYDTNPRLLVVAFGRPSGGYQLAVADPRLIPRLESPSQEDPFDELSVKAGVLGVKMHLFMSAGGWEAGGSSYSFRWQNGGFKLIGFDRDTVMRNSGETSEVSINYLTRRKLLKKGNIGSDGQTERWVTIPKKPLIDLTQIGDGLMFDPD